MIRIKNNNDIDDIDGIRYNFYFLIIIIICWWWWRWW